MGRRTKIRKRQKKRRILLLVLFMIIGLAVCALIYIRVNVKPIIIAFAKEKISALTSDAVSEAVLQIYEEDGDVDYIKVNRDENNNIKSIDTNVKAVSSIAQRITTRSHELINKIGSDGITIPFGSLTGLTVFTGLGPDVKVRVYLVGSTKTTMYSEFVSTGINQTLHRIYIDITGSVSVAIPGFPSTVKTAARVLMGETVIVGEVPPTYLQSSSIGDMLDLVVD